MPNFHVNSETIIGIALIAVGAFTFAKGTSQYLVEDSTIKSFNQVSNLVDTVNFGNFKKKD
jgi:hypothetical protein